MSFRIFVLTFMVTMFFPLFASEEAEVGLMCRHYLDYFNPRSEIQIEHLVPDQEFHDCVTTMIAGAAGVVGTVSPLSQVEPCGCVPEESGENNFTRWLRENTFNQATRDRVDELVEESYMKQYRRKFFQTIQTMLQVSIFRERGIINQRALGMMPECSLDEIFRKLENIRGNNCDHDTFDRRLGIIFGTSNLERAKDNLSDFLSETFNDRLPSSSDRCIPLRSYMALNMPSIDASVLVTQARSMSSRSPGVGGSGEFNQMEALEFLREVEALASLYGSIRRTSIPRMTSGPDVVPSVDDLGSDDTRLINFVAESGFAGLTQDPMFNLSQNNSFLLAMYMDSMECDASTEGERAASKCVTTMELLHDQANQKMMLQELNRKCSTLTGLSGEQGSTEETTRRFFCGDMPVPDLKTFNTEITAEIYKQTGENLGSNRPVFASGLITDYFNRNYCTEWISASEGEAPRPGVPLHVMEGGAPGREADSDFAETLEDFLRPGLNPPTEILTEYESRHSGMRPSIERITGYEELNDLICPAVEQCLLSGGDASRCRSGQFLADHSLAIIRSEQSSLTEGRVLIDQYHEALENAFQKKGSVEMLLALRLQLAMNDSRHLGLEELLTTGNTPARISPAVEGLLVSSAEEVGQESYIGEYLVGSTSEDVAAMREYQSTVLAQNPDAIFGHEKIGPVEIADPPFSMGRQQQIQPAQTNPVIMPPTENSPVEEIQTNRGTVSERSPGRDIPTPSDTAPRLESGNLVTITDESKRGGGDLRSSDGSGASTMVPLGRERDLLQERLEDLDRQFDSLDRALSDESGPSRASTSRLSELDTLMEKKRLESELQDLRSQERDVPDKEASSNAGLDEAKAPRLGAAPEKGDRGSMLPLQNDEARTTSRVSEGNYSNSAPFMGGRGPASTKGPGNGTTFLDALSGISREILEEAGWEDARKVLVDKEKGLPGLKNPEDLFSHEYGRVLTQSLLKKYSLEELVGILRLEGMTFSVLRATYLGAERWEYQLDIFSFNPEGLTDYHQLNEDKEIDRRVRLKRVVGVLREINPDHPELVKLRQYSSLVDSVKLFSRDELERVEKNLLDFETFLQIKEGRQ